MSGEKPNLEKINILLGVTGGIAVYKAVDLASKLNAAGASIRIIMTENACRFVTPKSFEAVTNSPAYTSMWTEVGEFNIEHINLDRLGRHYCRGARYRKHHRKNGERHLRRFAQFNSLRLLAKTNSYRAGDEYKYVEKSGCPAECKNTERQGN